MQVPISGEVKEGFEKVKTVFEENFEKRKEVGASCCVYYKGKKVVDLYGGYRDKNKKQHWEHDTLSVVLVSEALFSLEESLLFFSLFFSTFRSTVSTSLGILTCAIATLIISIAKINKLYFFMIRFLIIKKMPPHALQEMTLRFYLTVTD